ncbi:MAG: N-acetylneuraminate synthase [Deltaproteobacteria bacterium]|nr:MAG: N-acetylneuraminate synthase [Deltaproteobacteria bacterium]
MEIGPENVPRIVAEIGCNHRGEVETAKEMIEVAARFCGVDVVKFQKRCPKELLTPEQYAAPHPVPANSYGRTYGEHREALEFDVEVHRQLAAVCDEVGVTYACSVWDLTSAREIASLGPAYIKIPSACNTHFEMLGWLLDHYEGPLHVSLGMTTRKEEERIVEFFRARGRTEDLVLYACTSGYPVPPEDICLREITRLRGAYGHEVGAIGFSGHHLGIAPDIAAITLGASWVERHFTLNRAWKGTDHAASLEPDGMRRLARDIRNVAKALTYKSEAILPIEVDQRDKLKWRPRPRLVENEAA